MLCFHIFVTASARFFTPAAQSAMQIPVEQAKQLFAAAPRIAHVRPSPLSLSACASPVAAGLLPLGLSLSLAAVAGTRGRRLAGPAADVKLLSLVFLLDAPSSRVLLGMKKRGFGMGKYNGFGGKLEPGETMPECASRELHEESGCKVPVECLQARGRMHFHMLNDSGMLDKRTQKIVPHLYVYLFSAELKDVTECTQVIESDEMRPEWFDFAEVPLEKMWPDDKFWLPTLLSGRDVVGAFEFSSQDTIERRNVNALPRGEYAADAEAHEAAVALSASSTE